MNRCRRILAAALAAVMLLALTACGQSADTNNSAEQTVVRIGTPATGDHGARMLEAARVAAEKQYFEDWRRWAAAPSMSALTVPAPP